MNTKKLLLLLALLPLFVQAQVTLRGKVANMRPGDLDVAIAEYWNVTKWEKLAIIQMQNGVFDIKVNPPMTAQARLRLAAQYHETADFIIHQSGKGDTLLLFDLDARQMNGGPARITNSPENEGYFYIASARKELEKLQDSTSRATPEQILAAENELNKRCTETAKKYKGSFCGDIAANLFYQMQAPAGQDARAWAREHGLDKIIFQYGSNLQHEVFYSKLDKYFNLFGTDYIPAIDAFMAKRNGNEAVDMFMFRFLMDKMLAKMDEPGMSHLITLYPPDCTDDSPLPGYTKDMIEALKYCAPGNVVEDLKYPGPDGNLVSLADVCSKNKLTVIMFWKSNCSHCREYEPVLSEIYARQHPLGVEVYAMNLDRLEEGWKSTLQAHPTKWVNVYVPQDQRQAINRKFPIPSTPMLFALDRNRKILNRLIIREHLETYLNATTPGLK